MFGRFFSICFCVTLFDYEEWEFACWFEREYIVLYAPGPGVLFPLSRFSIKLRYVKNDKNESTGK